MSDVSKLESTLVGVAGEYYVAAELSLRGYLASITLRNSRGIDIIASSADGTRSVSIQVKTSSGGKPKWMLNQKAETFSSENHFYALVVLNGLESRPDFYIIPSNDLSKRVYESHKNWLAGTKKDGSARKNSAMRSFKDDEGEYRESWELLGLGS